VLLRMCLHQFNCRVLESDNFFVDPLCHSLRRPSASVFSFPYGGPLRVQPRISGGFTSHTCAVWPVVVCVPVVIHGLLPFSTHRFTRMEEVSRWGLHGRGGPSTPSSLPQGRGCLLLSGVALFGVGCFSPRWGGGGEGSTCSPCTTFGAWSTEPLHSGTPSPTGG